MNGISTTTHCQTTFDVAFHVVSPRPFLRGVDVVQDNIWISTASAAAVGFDPLRRLSRDLVGTHVGISSDIIGMSWQYGGFP